MAFHCNQDSLCLPKQILPFDKKPFYCPMRISKARKANRRHYPNDHWSTITWCFQWPFHITLVIYTVHWACISIGCNLSITNQNYTWIEYTYLYMCRYLLIFALISFIAKVESINLYIASYDSEAQMIVHTQSCIHSYTWFLLAYLYVTNVCQKW
jgi:hypothetical protein